MEFDEKELRIKWGINENCCPFCGKKLENIKTVGSGSIKDGSFCSLKCYSDYNFKNTIKKTKQIK